VSDVPSAVARVKAPRAERYLTQLVDHLTQLSHRSQPQQPEQPGHRHSGGGPGHAGPPVVRHVERGERHARIEFDWGSFELTATTSELVLEVHAADQGALARGQELVAHRVETIGRRDHLTVTWTPSAQR
jgi:hypothetical protein